MSLIISRKKSAEELAAAKALHETDVAYMRIALDEARRGAEAGEVPVGAILVIPPVENVSKSGARMVSFALSSGDRSSLLNEIGKVSESITLPREPVTVSEEKIARGSACGISTEGVSQEDICPPSKTVAASDNLNEASSDFADLPGTIVAASGNRKERETNPLRHAEMCVLEEGISKLGKYLDTVTLYVTLEPCAMCAGAMVNARLKRLVFGAADPKGGAAGSVVNILENPLLNHSVTVKSGVLGTECGAILSEFFKRRREEKINNRTGGESGGERMT